MLYLILGITSYVAMAGFVFGYTRAVWEVGQNGWEEPGPFFAGLLWPLFVTYALISYFPNKIGFKVANMQLERRRLRVAAQEKIRLELEQAEKELEEQLMQDDDDFECPQKSASRA